MFMKRDFDMHTTHRYADSLREALKETMLNQELVFRKQVHELHRLYMNQKTLMDDLLSMKDFNNFNSWNATTELTPNLHLGSLGYNLADVNTLSNNPLVGSTHSIDQQCSFDLSLHTDRFITHGDDEFQEKEHASNSPLALNNYSFCTENVYMLGKVNLSLGIGVDTVMKELGNTRYGEMMFPYAQEVIDLENSMERVSTEVMQLSALSNSFLSKCEKKEPAEVITLVDVGVSSPKRSSFNPGPLVHYESLPCESFLTKKQKVISSIDLNIVQLGDSSINTTDPLIAYPSTASSSIVLRGVLSEGVYGTSTCSIKCSPETSEEGNKMKGLSFPFPYQAQDMDQAASYSCVMDTNSIRAKTDMQPVIQLVDLNNSTSNAPSEISLGSEVAENAPELDVLIKMAADSLVCLSLEKLSLYPDCASKAEPKEIKNVRKVKPEYSCDSYESLVLKIPESSVDEYCVTSNLSEVDEIVKIGFGSKFKRGRRLKDFQKDILPGMVSLSRQEIREDVNIMKSVIRSREYRKIQAKKDIAVNWATPVRSRRSKRIYIGQNKQVSTSIF